METTDKVELYDKKLFAYESGNGILSNTWYNTKTTVTINIKGGGYNNQDLSCIIQMHGAASGCGFGIIGSWCAFVGYLETYKHINTKQATAFFVETIRKIALTNHWHCLLVTCGGYYLGKDGFPSKHEKWIQSIGFKEVDKFINLRDGPTHIQKVYTCHTKDLKFPD
jgi:hypothetical protein